MDKWAWVTPLYWNGHDHVMSKCEVLINLNKVKQIVKDEKNRYTVWFLGETHQDTIYINADGMKSILCVIDVR